MLGVATLLGLMLFGYMWLRYLLIDRQKAKDERHERWESWKTRMQRRLRRKGSDDNSGEP